MSKVTRKMPKQSRRLLVSALLAFIAAYIFGALAIDRGNWLYYGLTIASVLYGIRSLWRGLVSIKR